MQARTMIFGLLVVLLFVCSASSAAASQDKAEHHPSYLSLRLGYGLSLVDEDGTSSSYNLYGNQRIPLTLGGSVFLMTIGGEMLCLSLPFDADASFRFNDKWGIKRRYYEMLLDISPQLGLNSNGVTPFFNAGPTFSFSYLKYEYKTTMYDEYGHITGNQEFKDDYLSTMSGINAAFGGRVDLEAILLQLKLQYRFLAGTTKPLQDETKEHLDDISENRQTLGIIGEMAIRTRQGLYLEGGAEFEKSVDRFKYHYDWWGESDWGGWGKWSTGELRLFLGIMFEI